MYATTPWTLLSRVFVYDDPDTEGLDVDRLAHYLADRLPGAEVAVRRDYLTHQLSRVPEDARKDFAGQVAEQVRRAEVHNLVHPGDRAGGDFEDPADLQLGALYRGPALQALLALLLAPEDSRLDVLHILLTSRALGEWDGSRLFRLRIACLGEPSIISTTGLVEVPDLPRDYEFMRAQLVSMGLQEDLEDLAETFAERALGYGDRRITDVLKGYALMAVMYRMFGEGPCNHPRCRLYDAPTQEEMLEAQCGPEAGLCEHHAAMLAAAGGKPE